MPDDKEKHPKGLKAMQAAKLRMENAQIRGDTDAAAAAAQELREAALDMSWDSRYGQNTSSSIIGVVMAVVGLAVSIYAGIAAATGTIDALAGLIPGLLFLGIGGSLAYSCLTLRHRALPPRSLRSTGTRGTARVVEILAENRGVGWSNSGTTGTLYKWRLEVTLPGQPSYEAVVETFRDLPQPNASFPVYVDPNDQQKMFIGPTRPL